MRWAAGPGRRGAVPPERGLSLGWFWTGCSVRKPNKPQEGRRAGAAGPAPLCRARVPRAPVSAALPGLVAAAPFPRAPSAFAEPGEVLVLTGEQSVKG